MNTPRLNPLVLAFLLPICPQVALAEAQSVDFEKHVFRVLRRACFECHGNEKQEGELRLDRREDFLASKTVVPGKPAESELLRRITLPKGHDEIMPALGDPIPKREAAAIRRWIERGAEWPESFKAGKHWSYIAPVRPPSPPETEFSGFRENWIRNDIDRFVGLGLKAEQLQPSPEAEPATIVRRVFFDLIGLPPTPAEVNTFVADPSDEAYAKLVDNLLSRPQFGERWARPWLDLARYADSHGFQRDNLREVWAYRDWVIRALNADMPFDRFTIEQIAGDLLPNATESQRVATGFHRCTPTNVEAGSLPEETRVEQVIDRVNTTGAVWLGTTLECCQCHDHKYDPFSTKDYYRILAFFNSTELEADRANPKTPSSIKFMGPKMEISDAKKESQREELTRQRRELSANLKARKAQLKEGLPAWAAEFSLTLGNAPESHVLDVVQFRSTGQTDSHEILNDGSVLLKGSDPPSKDEYTVTAETSLKNVTAFRLDALTHDSLPGKGPGRGDGKKTNFVLNQFLAEVANPGGAGSQAKTTPLVFSKAMADFSQKNWDVNGAINKKPRTGWAIAPQFGKSHWANFVLATPLDISEDQLLTFRLKHDYGAARSIGRLKLSAITGDLGIESVPANVSKIVKRPAGKWSKTDRAELLAFRVKSDSQSARIQTQIDQITKQEKDLAADTTLVMIELPKPRKNYVFERGDYRNEGESVEPGTPGILHSFPSGRSNRLTFAQWLVSTDNPLVARVTVNRWWAEIFGRGIVPTLEDFGIKGTQPSHPELLDWLAVEFMNNGWSMKKVLRTIVLSSTYRQSSYASDESRDVDAENRLLARGPRLRMDAEMIRDNLLSAAGLLSQKQFGPSIRPYQPNGIWSKVGGNSYKYEVSPGTEQYRRGIYVVIKRGAPYPSFVNFDASARLACTVQRSRTNTPLQALTLLNDPVYVDAAKALTRRILTEKDAATKEDRIRFAFQLCTARLPTMTEQGILLDLLETQHSINVATAAEKTLEMNSDELPSGVSAPEFMAWQSVATTLLNLHETITKN